MYYSNLRYPPSLPFACSDPYASFEMHKQLTKQKVQRLSPFISFSLSLSNDTPTTARNGMALEGEFVARGGERMGTWIHGQTAAMPETAI